MDDIFALFDNKQQAEQFLVYLNQKHENIQFTTEYEDQHMLPFLGVNVRREGTDFITSIYRKPTFSGLTTNFYSFTPDIYKRNLIETLIYRAQKLCSCVNFLKIEIDFITKMLSQNGFPKYFIQKQINKFEMKTNTAIPAVNKQRYFLKLPYYGYHSKKIKESLKKLVDEYYPQLDLKLIFINKFKIESMFPYKDRIPAVLRSNLIYKYKCANCEKAYVGVTIRHLKTRISEHMGISPRTEVKISNPMLSHIREHCQNNAECSINAEDFKILESGDTEWDLKILESIAIKKFEPQLNIQDGLKLQIF